MGLLDTLEQKILDLLAPILGPLKGLVSLFTHFRDSTTGLLDAMSNLIESATGEYKAIKDFQSKPHWKSRVISAQRAFDNIKRLITDVPQSFIAAIKGLVADLRNSVRPETFNVEELEGITELKGVFSKFGTRIAAGLEKILGILGVILSALETIRRTIDNLQTIVDDIKEVRQDIENLDGLFLPQNNPRKKITTEIGSMRIREGNLHT